MDAAAGAEITGVDLAQPLDDGTFADIEVAFEQAAGRCASVLRTKSERCGAIARAMLIETSIGIMGEL